MAKTMSGAAAMVVGVLAVAVAPAPAGAAQSKCLVSKNKCAAKKAASLLKCEQKAETPGKDPDPNADGCVDKAEGKFDGGSEPEKGCFEKLENKNGNDCITFDDTDEAEVLVDQCVAGLVARIDPPPRDQTKCGVGKKKCVAKKLSGLLKCYQKAQTPGKPEDPNADGCIDKVKTKFDGGTEPEKGCFAKLEGKEGNDCLPPLGNTAELEQLVDGCAADLAALLETPTPTTTTSTTTPTPTTTSTTAPTPTTTSTTAPTPTTTTSTTAPTPTTTSTTTPTPTTTTTMPGGLVCGSQNRLEVTVALQYPPVVGGVSGVTMGVSYPPPLVIPGSGSLPPTNVPFLLGGGYTVQRVDRDTNADTVDDRLDVTVSSGTNNVPSAPIFRILYTCPMDTQVNPASLSCATSNAIDPSGLPFEPPLAMQITCNLTFVVP